MIKYVKGYDIGKQICEALGLDDNATVVDIHIAANDIVSLTVTYLGTKEQMEEVIEIVKKYELVEKKPESTQQPPKQEPPKVQEMT